MFCQGLRCPSPCAARLRSRRCPSPRKRGEGKGALPPRHAPDFSSGLAVPSHRREKQSGSGARRPCLYSILKTRRNLAPRRCFHRRLQRAGLDAMKRLTGLAACEARILPIDSVNRATVARPTRTPPPSLISGSRPGSRKGNAGSIVQQRRWGIEVAEILRGGCVSD